MTREKYQPLSDEDTKLLIKLTMIELSGQDLPDSGDLPFTCQIIKKRIEAMKLPVIIKNTGLLGTLCFAKSPGQAVTLLIDFLTMFEGKELSVSNLCEVYPWGFYTEEALTDYIDNVLKPKKSKWSEIY